MHCTKQLIVLIFLVDFCLLRISHSSQPCFENGLVIAALEASRLRGEIPDVRIVDYVRKWLVANGNELGDTKGHWAKLYSRVFMDLINGYCFDNTIKYHYFILQKVHFFSLHVSFVSFFFLHLL